MTGDWNGDGVFEIGVYRHSNGIFYLDLSGSAIWQDALATNPFGTPADLPIIGDWNGDIKDDI